MTTIVKEAKMANRELPQPAIEEQFTEGAQGISAVAQEQRETVEHKARELRESLRQERSGVEKETEAGFRAVRQEEKRGQRRRELPLTEPRVARRREDTTEIKRRKKEAGEMLSRAEREVEEAVKKDIEAIAKAEREALAELDRIATEFKAANVRLDTDEYVDKVAFEALPAELQAQLRTMGIEKFNELQQKLGTRAITKDQARAQREFEANYVQLGFVDPATGEHEWVSREFYNQLDDITKKYLDRFGVASYNRWTQSYQRQVEAGQVAQAEKAEPVASLLPQYAIEAIGADLQKFQALNQALERRGAETVEPVVGYDIPQMLRDHPEITRTQLMAAGFPREAYDNAAEYNQQDWVVGNPIETYHIALKDAGYYEENFAGFGGVQEMNKWYEAHPDIVELREVARNWKPEQTEPSLSLSAFTNAYLDARGVTQEGLVPSPEVGRLKMEAQLVYSRLYGRSETLESMGIATASMLFSPTRVLYPEVTIGEISPLEWAVGGAQLALLAVPGIGAASATAARVALGVASGIFLTQYALDFSTMNTTERIVNGAMIAVILGSLGVGGLVARVRAGRASGSSEVQLSRDLTALDRAQARYGTSSSQYRAALGRTEATLQRIQSEGISVSARATLSAATDAGQASRRLQTALREIPTRRLPNPAEANRIARLSQASRITDQRFGTTLSRVQSLTRRQLRAIERRSGMSGLRQSIEGINKAQTNLNNAWARAEELATRYGTDSPQYLRALQGTYNAERGVWSRAGSVVGAQGELEVAINRFTTVIEPRVKPSPATGYEGVISKVDDEIRSLQVELSRLERLGKAAIGQSEREALQRAWVETRDLILAREQQLGALTLARDAGIPAPTITRYIMKWETRPPTQEELRQLFKEFSFRGTNVERIVRDYANLRDYSRLPEFGVKPELQPALGEARPIPRTQVATAERPMVREQQLRLSPEFETVAPRPKPTTRVPTVTEPSTSVSTARPAVQLTTEYDVSYRDRMFDRPDIRETQDTYIEVVGEPLPGLEIVVAGRTSADPTIEREIRTTVANIVQRALREAIRLQNLDLTRTQIYNAVQDFVRIQTKAITQSATRAQVAQQVRVITKTATAVAERVRTRIRIPPISITLPDGSSHTLTPEEKAGAAGWKQGFMYKMIFPPYGKNDATNTRKPILGIPYFKGPQSAYRSIVRLGGKLPPKIMRDMGIMDIAITTGRYGKPRLHFKQDIEQKTRLTGKRRKKSRATATPMPTLGTMR